MYGNMRQPPGDENCPYQRLIWTKDGVEIVGAWAPSNSESKAMGLKWFFPAISGPCRPPEVKVLPLHVAVAFDAFKYRDVMELMKEYPGEAMKFGFFTSDIPGEAKLIAKTVEGFENRTSLPTFEEKIVIQLAKTNNDCLLAFSELGPSYMSVSAVEGEEECKIFFPLGYDEPEGVTREVKKKSRKKPKSKPTVVEETTEDKPVEAPENPPNDEQTVDISESEKLEDEEENKDDEEVDDDYDEAEEGESVNDVDKATSPMEEVQYLERENN